MALAITKPISFANGWKNIGTQATADGYTGSRIADVTIVNFNATVAYVHFTSDGGTSPGTAADGIPLSSTAATAPSAAFSATDVDINTIWVHTAGTQTIKYSVIGR